MTWPEIWSNIGPLYRSVIDTGKTVGFDDYPLQLLRNGKLEDAFFSFSYNAIRDEAGLVGGLLVACEETTSRVLNDRRLTEERDRLFSILMQAQVPIAILTGPDHVYELANPLYVEMVNREVHGKTLAEVFAGEEVSYYRQILDRVLQSGKPAFTKEAPLRLHDPDGSYRDLNINVSYHPYRNKIGLVIGVMVTVHDVTEQIQARTALEAYGKKLDAVVQSLTEGIIFVDQNGSLLLMNPEALKIHGFRNLDEMISRIVDYEGLFKLYTLEGVLIPLSEWPASKVIAGQKFSEFEVLVNRMDTGKKFYGNYGATPVYSESGEFLMGVLTVRDITDKMTTAQELRNAVKSRDELLSICSHELRTPVTSMKLQTELVKRSLAKGDPLALAPERMLKMVSQYDRQLDRLTRLIEEMLDFSRVHTGSLRLNLETVDLEKLVLEVEERLEYQAQAVGCKFEVLLEPQLSGFWDRFRLEQVLTNVIGNAIKYAPGKLIRIETSHDENFAYIKVIDQGIGISVEMLNRVFEPYQRASSVTNISGLGLGLYITKQIVTAHRGTITVESRAGEGAVFKVALPRNSEHRA